MLCLTVNRFKGVEGTGESANTRNSLLIKPRTFFGCAKFFRFHPRFGNEFNLLIRLGSKALEVFESEIEMKVLELFVVAAVLTCAAARVVGK